MKLVFFLFLAVIALATCKAEAPTPCTSQDQCAADECCEIINIILVSRKRQLTGGPNTSGYCSKLIQEGKPCSNVMVVNGACGCAPGLTCTPMPDPFAGLGRIRRLELPATCTADKR
ncbi:hypothetical protein BaRGS_00015380 [Batillaria attramentaria]|uniref:Uncharacterized protein n=1 Tax=Batillaria attramentaria TaxID=370345 RepID=A0ABD0L2C1_9CAEN